MRRLLSFILLFIISFSISLPKGICASGIIGIGGPVSIENFFDMDSDTSDDRPEDNGHCKKVDAAEPYFIPTRFHLNVKLNAVNFLERLPSFIASYYKIFHVPPSL
ncbi:hypothetical protein ACJVC5_16285 [Peredibacter sp. HCB2-198]|uniref:hypothetical protein n=1 Tax=Peredibacter sp. HCB2-198 TaxID=3383025 RepID=UPI0038B57798